MPPKKQRIDVDAFLHRSVNLLIKNSGRLREDLFYEELNILCTDQTSSILIEHPSLHRRGGYICLLPFARIASKNEIRTICSLQFPKCFRIVDMLGLYQYISNDINDMLFSGILTLVDEHTKSFTVIPEKKITFDDNIVGLWNAV